MEMSRWSDYLRCSRPVLLGRLHAKGVSTEDSEDALQEVIVRLTVRVHVLGMDRALLQDERRLLAWLSTTAWRVVLDQRRHVHPTISLSDDRFSFTGVPGE